MTIKKIIKNKSGYSLIWVLIFLAVAIILGTALLSIAMAETRHAARSEKQMQANYIARSGVEAGFLTLQTLSTTSTATTLQQFTDAANLYITNNSLKTKTVGNGSYTITYVPDPNPNSFFITIRSDATHANDTSIKSKVELYINSTFLTVPGMNWTEAPRSWIRAANLWDNVNPDSVATVDLTGSPVIFTGTPTKSPQNSVSPSIFRATLLYFRGFDRNNKVSFLQQVNTNHITFDAEVMVFEGKILMRDNRPLILRSSDSVLRDDVTPFVPWTHPGLVGFENKGRYQSFIGVLPTDPTSIYVGYGFPGTATPKFGLISITGSNQAPPFTSGVYKDGVASAVVPDGIYFFKDGTDLNRITPLVITTTYTAASDLIIVDPNDPIRNALIVNQGTRYIRGSTEKFLYSSD